MNDEAIIAGAQSVLEDLTGKKLWMTARVLARRLRHRPGSGRISQVRLFEALARHAAAGRGHRAIRNSSVPSARTLEVLWGAVAKVEERDVDPPFLRTVSPEDDPIEALESSRKPQEQGLEEQEDAARPLFLSYNFKDSEAAREVADVLEARGHSIWIAGTRIALGEFINARVRKAIASARGLVLYLSADSLRSLWVAKEHLVGEAKKLPRTIVVKGDDPDLMTLVRHWMSGAAVPEGQEEPGIPMHQTMSYGVAKRFREMLRETAARPDRVIYLHPAAGQADGDRLLDLTTFPAVEAED